MRARSTPFLVLWSLAVGAATTAFVVYLAMRVESIEMGYELGKSHGELSRLREVKRTLELELSSYKTPERVDFIARTLLGMRPPEPSRVRSAGSMPTVEEAEQDDVSIATTGVSGEPTTQ